jgi:predicted esterase
MPPNGNVGSGPLVFYYYGLLGFPANAVTPLVGFPPDAMQRLYDAGGILVAPSARADRNPVKLSRLPWIGALGFEDDMGDFLLVDEIVACAIEKVGIDIRRIHVSGLSAGAWMTSQVAVHRSNYVASVTLFSGGVEDLHGLQDPTNKFPLAMFNGGTSDFVGAHFENEAQSAVNVWRHEGHFAVNCNHNNGHNVPVEAGLAGMQFLLDHPYGTVRSPYCDAAPPETSFCALTTPATLGVVPDAPAPASDVSACSERVGEAGLSGGAFTDELVSCGCSRCGGALAACLDDAGCADIMRCAVDHACFGISCYQDPLCAPVIDTYGGAVGASSQLAVAFSDCVGAAACDPCSMPPR